MSQAVQAVQELIGHTFQDPRLCEEALTTAGVFLQLSDGAYTFDGNAALALIGDGFLRVAIAIQSRELRESKWAASNRMLVASNNNLANVFDTTRLAPYVVNNSSQWGMISVKTKATVIEALLGAVLVDGGHDATLAVMERLQIS